MFVPDIVSCVSMSVHLNVTEDVVCVHSKIVTIGVVVNKAEILVVLAVTIVD